MFVNGFFVQGLKLTKEKLDHAEQIFKLGPMLWVFLTVSSLLSPVFIKDAEMTTIWVKGINFLEFLLISGYALLFTVIMVMESVYGYSPLTLKKNAGYTVLLMALALGCLVMAFTVNWPYFRQLCKLHPAHLGLLIPLGLTVIYLTAVSCELAGMIKAWLHDCWSWRMANYSRESMEGGGFMDGTDTAKRLSFRDFCKFFTA